MARTGCGNPSVGSGPCPPWRGDSRNTGSLTAQGAAQTTGRGHWVIADSRILSVSVQPCATTALTPGQGDVAVLQFPKGAAMQARLIPAN